MTRATLPTRQELEAIEWTRKRVRDAVQGITLAAIDAAGGYLDVAAVTGYAPRTVYAAARGSLHPRTIEKLALVLGDLWARAVLDAARAAMTREAA